VGAAGGHSVAGVPQDPRQALGRRGEQLALEHLERLGFALVAANHRTRFGELDLVVAREGLLVFCEVKARRAGSGDPWDSLHPGKQAQVRRMARAFLGDVDGLRRFSELRFDAVGVVLDGGGDLVRLDHLEGAF
jgi:putative endonuclease